MRKIKKMRVVALIVILLNAVTVADCKQGQESTNEKSPAAGDVRTQTSAQTKANVQTFVTYKYSDPMTAMEALRLLIPKGWHAEGKITWSANPALPAQARFRISNPKGTEEFNIFPTQSYFWTNNQMFLGTNPPGSMRFGTLVVRPIDLHTAFTQVIIPYVRSGVGGVRIIEEKEMAELARIARGQPVQGVHSSAQGGKIRIQYPENGRPMEEEMYAAVSQFVTYMPGSAFTGNYFINYWYIDYVFSFKAQKGKLDSQAKVFQTMVYSIKVNPRWFAKVANVREMMAQQIIRGIKTIGHIGEMAARASSNMREDQLKDWERRQQANDRIIRNFSDNILGVERFHDPFAGKEVELPAGYGRAFANNLGEYIVTESPSYNPNIGSNLHWEELTPAR
jgi:hypothetical protein